MNAITLLRDPGRQVAFALLTAVAGLAWVLIIACTTQEPIVICGDGALQFANGASALGLPLRLALMWTVMAPAMMLPAGAADILRTLSDHRFSAAPASAGLSFSAGYLAVVTIGGFAGATLIGGLLWTGIMSPDTMRIGSITGGGVLVVLGLYYFSPFKRQSMESYGRSGWHSGEYSDPMSSGWLLGLSSLDDCAVMICIQCVFGVMNLYLMAGLVIWMVIERVLPNRETVARLTGAGLILAGLAIAAG